MKFKDIINNDKILKIIEESGFVEPTEIQSKIIPLIEEGNDVLGQSQTGTGKTLAFGAPIINGLEYTGKVESLIIAPTRELAIQIATELEKIGKYTKTSITCVYGSSRITDQINKLKNKTNIVVGTPGRVKDLIKRNALKLDHIKYFVLDEADEMLSMGFEEEIEDIFNYIKNDKQVLLFSATIPKKIEMIAKKYMKKDYKTISISSHIETATNVNQFYYVIDDKSRVEAMCRVIDLYNPNRSMIFCRTKRNADDLLTKLIKKGYSVDLIHGDITQSQRINTLEKFKAGIFKCLIATDVAARGIHVDDVELVINYNIPESNEAYVHRVGRTGRVQKKGVAVSFVKANEINFLKSLEKITKSPIIKQDIPSIEEIMNSKMDEISPYITSLLDNNYDEKYDKYLNSLTKDELKKIVSIFINNKIESSIGASSNNIEVNTTIEKKKKKRDSSDGIRVFLTVGKLDKITKNELLTKIETLANVPKNTCTGVEILSKFTFMNINKKYYDVIMDKCSDMVINKRKIKLERAKK